MTSYKRWFLPLVIGALLGAVLAPLVSFLGSSFAYPGGYFVSPRMVELAGSLPLAAAAQSLLGGVFGAVVGAAALVECEISGLNPESALETTLLGVRERESECRV